MVRLMLFVSFVLANTVYLPLFDDVDYIATGIVFVCLLALFTPLSLLKGRSKGIVFVRVFFVFSANPSVVALY